MTPDLVTLSWLEEETGRVRMQEKAEVREDHERRLKRAHSLRGVLDLPRREGWIPRPQKGARESPSLLLSFLTSPSLHLSFLDTPYQHLGARPSVSNLLLMDSVWH